MRKEPILLLIITFIFLIGFISLFSEAGTGGGAFFLAAACVPAFFRCSLHEENASSPQTKRSTSTKSNRSSKTATLSDQLRYGGLPGAPVPLSTSWKRDRKWKFTTGISYRTAVKLNGCGAITFAVLNGFEPGDKVTVRAET